MKMQALIAAVVMLASIPTAQAQLVGNDGWSYQSSNRSFHAQGQLLRRQAASSAASSAGGSGTYNVYSSTTIGNLEQITQTLAEGATANLNTNSNQTTTGTQNSTTTGSGNGGTSNWSGGHR